MTFRLAEEMLEELKEEAEGTQMSVNTLVNQILKKHVDWERHSSKIGLIPFPRQFVKDLFRGLDKKRIQEIACGRCKEEMKEMILLKEGDFTLRSFVSTFNDWLRSSSLAHRYKKNSGGHHYVIYHRLSEKFSLYLATLLSSVLGDLKDCRCSTSIRKDSMSLTILSDS